MYPTGDDQNKSSNSHRQPRSVMVLQLKRIGDLVLTSPILSGLRSDWPDCKLTVVTNAPSSGILPLLEADHKLIFRSPWGGAAFWKAFTKIKPEVVLDFSGTDRTALLTALSGAQQKITYARFARKPLRRQIYSDLVDSSVANRHTVDHHWDLLTPLGLSSDCPPVRVHVPSSAKTHISNLLLQLGVSGPFLIVHPGTARPEKYWSARGWSQVINELARDGKYRVVLTGSRNETEDHHLAEISQSLKQPAIQLQGKLSLTELAALIQQSSLLLGVDSAPCHLADALEVPTVVLFGPTNPFHWSPRGKLSRVVTPGGKLPTGPSWPHPSMDEIPPEAVVETARALLAGN